MSREGGLKSPCCESVPDIVDYPEFSIKMSGLRMLLTGNRRAIHRIGLLLGVLEISARLCRRV